MSERRGLIWLLGRGDAPAETQRVLLALVASLLALAFTSTSTLPASANDANPWHASAGSYGALRLMAGERGAAEAGEAGSRYVSAGSYGALRLMASRPAAANVSKAGSTHVFAGSYGTLRLVGGRPAAGARAAGGRAD